MSGIRGYPAGQKLTKLQAPLNEFVTVQPMDNNLRTGMDVVSRSAFRVNSATVARTALALTGNPSDNSGTVVVDTATPARVGDYVRFETGNAVGLEIAIAEVSTNSFKLAAVLPAALAPVATDTFYILRYATQRLASDGTPIVTTSAAPIQYVLNAVNTEVAEVTATPANSRPLPVKILGGNGNEAIGNTNETAPASDTATAGINGRLQRIAQRITSLIALLPTSIGQKAKATSLAVTLATDEDLLTNIGAVNETAPASDTASSGNNGRLQRIAQRLTSLIALLPASIGQKAKATSLAVTLASDEDLLTNIGAVNETAPASDTASSGNNGRLQRIAQRLTSLIALLPSSIGQKTKTGSLSVVMASDDDSIALMGALNETAPASDTASAGQNGRLQRIAQRITSLIALLPASLGQKAMANSLAVTMASDQTGLPPPTDVSSSGSVSALNDVVTIACAGLSTVGIQTGGSWTGTLAFEGSTDGGTTYNAVYVSPRGSVTAVVQTATAVGFYYTNVAGLTHFRVRRSVLGNGNAATVNLIGNASASLLQVYSIHQGSFNISAVQSGTWTTRLNDGGGTSVTVGQKVMASSLPVTIASDQTAIPISGTVTASAAVYKEKYTLDFATSNVLTSAWTQLAASTTNTLLAFEIYNTTSEPIIFATGAVASEVAKFYIFPGGNAPNIIYLTVTSSTRLSLKALTNNITSGYILVNCLG